MVDGLIYHRKLWYLLETQFRLIHPQYWPRILFYRNGIKKFEVENFAIVRFWLAGLVAQ